MSLFLAWSICVLKITTDPLPLAMIPMFSVPISLIPLPGYLACAKFRNQTGSMFVFPALMVFTIYSLIGDLFEYACMGFFFIYVMLSTYQRTVKKRTLKNGLEAFSFCYKRMRVKYTG